MSDLGVHILTGEMADIWFQARRVVVMRRETNEAIDHIKELYERMNHRGRSDETIGAGSGPGGRE